MVELFPKNLANLGPRFGPLFWRFPLVKQLKYPKFFSRASRAGLSYFQNFPNSQIHGRVISEIPPILEIHGKVDGGGVNFISMVSWSPVNQTIRKTPEIDVSELDIDD